MSYKRTLIAIAATLLIGALVVLCVWIAWKVPPLMISEDATKLTPNELLERENDARTTVIQGIATLAQIAGGLVLLVGLYYTWRNVRAVEQKNRTDQENAASSLRLTQEQMKANQDNALKNLEIAQSTAAKNLQIAQETLNASLRHQITERFMQAVEQLGDSQRQVKLAGIYTLERIAKESEQDHWPIMEILTTYVRMNSPHKKQDTADNQFFDEVQAICKVLRRREVKSERESQIIDLHGADLQNINLEGAVLKNANFSTANLCNANLANANLENADFSSTKMVSADLTGVSAAGAKFPHASLDSANFSGAVLNATDFERAQLVGTDFDQANLQSAFLYEAQLGLAKLRYANLQHAGLQGADLGQAQLYAAHLENANLTRANLSGAYLKEAHLEGANLDSAAFSQADLTDAHLEGASLALATLYLTKLHGVDLSKTTGLTKWKELSEAQIDAKTLLPAAVIEDRNRTQLK